MKPQVLDHEPGIALFVPDRDPLVFYRQILTVAPTILNNSGSLYVETSQFHAADTASMMVQNGYEVELRKDLAGNDRMIRASRTAQNS